MILQNNTVNDIENQIELGDVNPNVEQLNTFGGKRNNRCFDIKQKCLCCYHVDKEKVKENLAKVSLIGLFGLTILGFLGSMACWYSLPFLDFKSGERVFKVAMSFSILFFVTFPLSVLIICLSYVREHYGPQDVRKNGVV